MCLGRFLFTERQRLEIQAGSMRTSFYKPGHGTFMSYISRSSISVWNTRKTDSEESCSFRLTVLGRSDKLSKDFSKLASLEERIEACLSRADETNEVYKDYQEVTPWRERRQYPCKLGSPTLLYSRVIQEIGM